MHLAVRCLRMSTIVKGISSLLRILIRLSSLNAASKAHPRDDISDSLDKITAVGAECTVGTIGHPKEPQSTESRQLVHHQVMLSLVHQATPSMQGLMWSLLNQAVLIPCTCNTLVHSDNLAERPQVMSVVTGAT